MVLKPLTQHREHIDYVTRASETKPRVIIERESLKRAVQKQNNKFLFLFIAAAVAAEHRTAAAVAPTGGSIPATGRCSPSALVARVAAALVAGEPCCLRPPSSLLLLELLIIYCHQSGDCNCNIINC